MRKLDFSHLVFVVEGLLWLVRLATSLPATFIYLLLPFNAATSFHKLKALKIIESQCDDSNL